MRVVRWSRLGGPLSARKLALLMLVLGSVLAACSEQAKEKRSAAPAPALSAATPARPVSQFRRRNLILITLDTTRADALGTYGQILRTSPNLDHLANQGVLFEQVTTSAPETLPSHATIFTGQWPFVHGVRSNAGYVLSDRNITLAEILRQNGYRTAAEVAAPVLRKETQITQGFDEYRGTESPGVELKVIRFTQGAVRQSTRQIRVGSDITRSGIDFIRRNRDQPFFLWLHYFDPHNPYSPPAAFHKKIPESTYHAEVAFADSQIGLLVQALRKLGLDEHTLLAVTADHGEGLQEHGEPSHTFLVYDTTMRVPLIFWGLPELARGTRITSLVRTIDILPTALDLLGIEPVRGIPGVSLGPLVRGEARDVDLDLIGYGEATRFAATFGMAPLRFVRQGRWKYIHKVNPELYDVISDPAETKNLMLANPEVALRLKARLAEMLAQAPEPASDAQATIDEGTAAQLVALGYVAHSPSFAMSDDPASLVLEGDDPNTKMDDVAAIARSSGLMGRGEFEEAMKDLGPLRDRNPRATFVLDLYAAALTALGRDAEAAAELTRANQIEPDNVDLRFKLAKALRRSDASEQARGILSSLHLGEPCDPRFGTELVELLRDQELWTELAEVLGLSGETCVTDSAMRNNYAWALATLPDPEARDGRKAVEIMRELVARESQPDPALLDTLAAALAEVGEFEEAERIGARVLRELRSAELPEDVLAQVGRHLEAYRAGRPIREP